MEVQAFAAAVAPQPHREAVHDAEQDLAGSVRRRCPVEAVGGVGCKADWGFLPPGSSEELAGPTPKVSP